MRRAYFGQLVSVAALMPSRVQGANSSALQCTTVGTTVACRQLDSGRWRQALRWVVLLYMKQLLQVHSIIVFQACVERDPKII
jgi:hypothetical protein